MFININGMLYIVYVYDLVINWLYRIWILLSVGGKINVSLFLIVKL